MGLYRIKLPVVSVRRLSQLLSVRLYRGRRSSGVEAMGVRELLLVSFFLRVFVWQGGPGYRCQVVVREDLWG